MLQGKGILTPIQRAVLSIFPQLPDQDNFYLTGGTALSEFYLAHRLSFDLDFFTSEEKIILPFSRRLEQRFQAQGWTVTVPRRFSTFVELILTHEGQEVRLDLGLDSPFRFSETVPCEYGVHVNDYRDLTVDKLLAYYGRAELRDAVDLYFILRTGESLDTLMELAVKKDPGFDVYWFASALHQAKEFPDELERWPVKMLQPFRPTELKHLFQTKALEIMTRMKR